MASRDVTGRIKIHTPETYRKFQRSRTSAVTHGGEWETPEDGNANEFDNYQLPWEDVTNGPQSLFKYSPPKIKYPAGIEDPNKIKYYKLTIDGFLRESQAVKQVLSGLRKHPFIDNKELYDYAVSKNITDYKFVVSETQKTITWVKKENESLALKLTKLYNFGGIYSYATITEQIYMIYFKTLNPDITNGDLHIISDCERYDGITARQLIHESLQSLRIGDISSKSFIHSQNISNAKLPMRTGGAEVYFGVLDEQRLALVNLKQPLPDTEVVGRIFKQLKGMHKELDHTIKELRRKAGKEKRTLTYKEVKEALKDTFKFDVPDTDKTDKQYWGH